ncbi:MULTISPECIES: Phenylacetic acid catabolic protein [unclassified Paracoccus (in: a-proteobacteria)]|uniref:Phenylacetic acid catabolic protein n=1 Tax=unclassified Paracoccus (in: a-proteobacteria) TaxID=2688777 RepID=UPI0012B2F95A|nr:MULTISPECIES: Phenylacetic acid catabolic protein [unclassified Paracoccus (in: a-proteobacteria)]UXU76682.1 phenylacetate-CoA oxygenase subunit PaaI [Paracoccus sp. SMMA_5]UXU82571.1 phenylacetate-CoA oxygenase subunit PaaI [Paracoccus sp. SMMA_5_TC]
MSDTMNLDDYLAQGGVLTAPGNVPARYRGELMRLMSSFVDSELAASAGFADSINFAPGIKERIAASVITLEKADHAGQVLEVMGDFGTDMARYQAAHDWAARVDRDADLGSARLPGDMRLSVLHYPIIGWTDAVVMNVLQGLATGVQMTELTRVSYGPLAEVFRRIAPREARHAELGLEGLERIVASDEGRAEARAAVAYWRPRVAAGFGIAHSDRYQTLARFGLRHQPNEVLLARWQALADEHLAALGL